MPEALTAARAALEVFQQSRNTLWTERTQRLITELEALQ